MLSLLLLFLSVAIVTSFLCSLWEAVLLSVTPSYAQMKMQEGGTIGKTLQSFKDNIDRPLAAILTLNTIAHTVGAIGVGEQSAKIWAEANPLITSVIVPVFTTFAILIFSELIPKTLGANYWKELAPFTARSLALMIRLLFPLVWFSQFITKALKKDKAESVFSRTDFAAMATIGAEQGIFRPEESDIITNLLRFNEVQVADIMTPRVVVVMAPAEQSSDEFHSLNSELRFSRIPLFQANKPDHISGYFLKDDLLSSLVADKGSEPLSTLCREMLVVQSDYSVPELFKKFLKQREHIALVVDQFGGMAGIVTMEDVIETLLGTNIIDETDRSEDMRALAKRNWHKRAKKMGLEMPDDGVTESPSTN